MRPAMMLPRALRIVLLFCPSIYHHHHHHHHHADGFVPSPSRQCHSGSSISSSVVAFPPTPTASISSTVATSPPIPRCRRRLPPPRLGAVVDSDDDGPSESIAVTIDTTLSECSIRKLFAWIKCAFESDGSDNDDAYAYYYNNIELAIAASFGNNLPDDSLPAKLLDMAMRKEGLSSMTDANNANATKDDDGEWANRPIGDAIGRRDRESASLGAMGAAQWSGRWMTRPHSLLNVRDFDSVDDWINTLPRGCKRTLRKATPQNQNFTVTSRPIRGGHPAPHSSYAHFRCVVRHEVRLLSNMYGSSPNAFVNALAEAISRFMGTTRMAGTVREYRDVDTNVVIGFAHEVAKGRTLRGQWFYCDDDASSRYVWFHSVCDLVRRAIEDDRIDVVDLGPSGSDAFTELKMKYGFESVVDWPAAADYGGDFIYEDHENEMETMGDDMIRMIEALTRRHAAREAKRDDKD